MKKLFSPNAVAIVGASRDATKVGHSVMKNMIDAGYKGKLYPVNPNASRILGHTAYRSVESIPETIDLVVIAVPAKFVPDVIAGCGRKKIKYAAILSSGFKEIGQAGERLQQAITKEAQRYKIRILGPNCLGIIHTHTRVNASFAGGSPSKGSIAVVSQSGAIGVSMIDWMRSSGVGMHSFVSLGNESDITELDIIEHLTNDASAKVITMYLEQITDVPRFMHVVSKASKKKPVIVLLAGQSKKAQEAIQSHTGSLATSHAVLTGLIRQSGGIMVSTLEELFNATILLQRGYIDASLPLTIVTNAGGPGVVAVDLLDSVKVDLATHSKAVKNNLKRQLPDSASVMNPIDVLGDADEKRINKVLNTVLKTKSNILLVLTPQSVTPVDKIAKLIVSRYSPYKKKLSICFIGGKSVEESRCLLLSKGFSVFSYPSQFSDILSLVKRRYENKKTIKLSKLQGRPLHSKSKLMKYADASKLLRKYGIPAINGKVVTSTSAIPHFRYPVAAKVLSDKAVHKKASGGLVLNIADKRQLRKTILTLKKKFRSNDFEGVLVQPMVEPGFECIVGAKRSAEFGLVVSVGVGGSFAEEINKVAFRRWPLTQKQVADMIHELAMTSLFKKVDTRFLTKVVLAVGSIAHDNQVIKEIDLNPVTVYKKGGNIIDVRFIKEV